MTLPTVFFVGRSDEVAHHAAPFQERLNVRIAGAPEVLDVARPADLAIFYSEHFDRFRDCCQQLKQRNVATLYLVDGILEWRNAWENRQDEVACPYAMRPVLSHKVACIGPSQARVLDGWGNASRTEIVGIPRFDQLTPANPSSGSPDEFRVLVMTAKTPGFTPEQHATVKESLRDLKEWQIRNPEIQGRKTNFIWRLTGGLANEIDVEDSVSDLTGIELKNVIEKSDAVITTPSTAMLEAMLMDRPVAVLDYHNCPQYVSSGWTIIGKQHIDTVVAELAHRPEPRMLFQRQQLADALSFDGSATSRLVDLATSMMTIAKKQVAQNRTLEFPSHLLEVEAARWEPFDHQKIYPDQPEFAIQDLPLLQAELSHTRREISHLNGEIAQLQSELGEAHQIFEQIEKHPIAGPVVRIRQKMLDLMTTIRKRNNKPESGSPNTVDQDNQSNLESSSN